MTATTILPHREVRFDHDTGDYLMFLDNRFVGYAGSEPTGLSKLNAIAYSIVNLPEQEGCPPIECHDLATMMRQSPDIGYATQRGCGSSFCWA